MILQILLVTILNLVYERLKYILRRLPSFLCEVCHPLALSLGVREAASAFVDWRTPVQNIIMLRYFTLIIILCFHVTFAAVLSSSLYLIVCRAKSRPIYSFSKLS